MNDRSTLAAALNRTARSLPALCIALALTMALGMAIANRGLLGAEIHEVSDQAANSLLIQDAKSLSLLTGNYSRLGFNHPGPAFLYVLAAGEVVFHDLLGWVRSPVAGQVLAMFALNAVWAGMLLGLFARVFRSHLLGFASAALFLAFTALQDPGYLNTLWFPFFYYFPFAVFTLALARMASGHGDALWMLCLAASFLVHGHASFIAIAGIMMAGGLVAAARSASGGAPRRAWWPMLRDWAVRCRMQLLACAGIVIAFAIPIVLNTALHFPGEIPKYLTYGRGFAGNGLRESLEFVSYFWGGGLFGLVTGLVMLALLWDGALPSSSGSDLPREDLRGVVWAVALATLALAFYARTGIDVLALKYTGLFYFAAVNVALVTAAIALLSRAPVVVRQAGAAGAVALALVVLATMPRSTMETNPAIPGIVSALRELPRRPVVLDLDRHNEAEWPGLWSTVAGVAAYSKRRGERVICIDWNWHILFTEGLHCSKEDMKSGIRVLATARNIERKPDDGIIDLGNVRFITPSLVRLAEGATVMLTNAHIVEAARILREGWSAPEREFTWSLGPTALVEFRVDPPGAFRLALDVAAFVPFAHSTQVAEVRAGGSVIGQFEFSAGNNRAERVVTVPAQAISPEGRVTLALSVRNPVSPASVGVSLDPRPLGVALRSLRVQPPGG